MNDEGFAVEKKGFGEGFDTDGDGFDGEDFDGDPKLDFDVVQIFTSEFVTNNAASTAYLSNVFIGSSGWCLGSELCVGSRAKSILFY